MTSKIIYPLVCKGTVTAVDSESITFMGEKTKNFLTIRHTGCTFDIFKPGDIIYYSYALSKENFELPNVYQSVNDVIVPCYNSSAVHQDDPNHSDGN